MVRGGSLNEPTLGQVPPGATPAPAALPPARRPRRGEETATVERARSRKSNFLPFLLAILMAGALLALIGWQAGPWANSDTTQENASTKAPTQSKPQQTPQQSPAPAQQPSPVPQQAQQAQQPDKPSPMPSGPINPANEPADHAAAAAPQQTTPASSQDKSTENALEAAGPNASAPRPAAPARSASRGTSSRSTQPVTVISSPGSATATLDGRPETACTTPCSLEASPGRHTIAITMPGYQIEHREVEVGSAPLELPAVLLRAPSGTLMLTSVPAGASISINGKKSPELTPARLLLPPGSYNITVEKDGIQSTSPVEIRNGETKLLKVTLQQ